MLSVEVTECKPLSERIKNVEANCIMQSGRWILSAYQFSGKWNDENNAVKRNLNAWVERARVFGTVIFGQYRILSPLFLLLI